MSHGHFPQSHHHVRGDRRDSHADDVAAPADHARRDRRKRASAPRAAGAAIVHLHARAPDDGRPVQDPDLFRQFLPRIKAASDVVVNLTTGGAQTMTVEERLQPALQLQPEIASLNMGTMNFGLYEMLPRYQSWRFEWEPAVSGRQRSGHVQEHAEGHRRHPARVQRQRHALRARVLRHRPPVHGGAFSRPRPGAAAALHPVGVRHSRRHRSASGGRAAREAHGRPAVRRRLSVVGRRRRASPDVRRGRNRLCWAATCASAWKTACGSARASSPTSNAEQVAKIRRILEELGLEIATPDDARRMLQLKGASNVRF